MDGPRDLPVPVPPAREIHDLGLRYRGAGAHMMICVRTGSTADLHVKELNSVEHSSQTSL